MEVPYAADSDFFDVGLFKDRGGAADYFGWDKTFAQAAYIYVPG